VEVEVDPCRPLSEALDEEPDLLLVRQQRSVVLRVALDLGQLLSDGRLPERQPLIMAFTRDVDHDHAKPAEMRHCGDSVRGSNADRADTFSSRTVSHIGTYQIACLIFRSGRRESNPCDQ
jgi:hypothetical protein